MTAPFTDPAGRWLLTNGLGGFAMGSAIGANMSRYHGWLIASANPPVGRVLALHSVVEDIELAGSIFSIASQRFGETFHRHPDGWKRLVEFRAALPHAATWTYAHGGARISRTLRLVAGRNAVNVMYEIEGPGDRAQLRLRPLLTMRDFHGLRHAGGAASEMSWSVESAQRLLVRSREPAGLALELQASDGAWREEPNWWHDFAYADDRDRGQHWREDAWTPGVLHCDVPLIDGRCRVVLTAELVQPHHVRAVASPPPVQREATDAMGAARRRLELAADQFIVQRTRRNHPHPMTTIMAGYPWFADWGRDAMIALPGLLLTTGRHAEAESVLMLFAQAMQDGLIPNRFDDYTDRAHYNTVDASLWFIHAVRELLRASPQTSARGALLGACRTIVAAYRAGTMFDIRMDDDGLIAAGNEHTQLTWMDAQRDGVTFTPRFGKAVEVNALWHHALHCLASMTDEINEASELHELASRVAASFRRAFWWAEKSCCFDLAPECGLHGRQVRPNQIVAVSLEHSPLTPEQQRGVVNIVRERLLTPFGLRTLDPADPEYKGRFEGDLMQRDAAYHQGTVWPWLIGPFCEAMIRTGSSREEVETIIAPLLGELDHGCVGQIAEVYDGDAPHRAGGCAAQAWSVGELLRVLAMLADCNDSADVTQRS